MLSTLILGVLTSLLTEAVTWVNKKLNGTVLAGDGAFIVSLVVAFLGAGLYEVVYLHQSLSLATLLEVWAVTQVWFVLIAQKIGLTVK